MSRATLLVLLLTAGVALACSSSDTTTTCKCNANINGDQRDLTCNQSACIAGDTYTCGSDAELTKATGCGTGASSSSSSSSSSSGGASSSSSSSGSTTDTSCTSLTTYCNTKCVGPEAVHADCLKTANDGNGTKCVAWQSANGSLCKTM